MEVNRTIDAARRQLETFKQSKQNKLSIFGAWVPEAVRRIKAAEQQQLFHETPVGPIGEFLPFTTHCEP